MTRTINLSNTQFGYQIVFFIHTHRYIWLAEGCLWHLFPRQTCCRHLLTGGMFSLLQRIKTKGQKLKSTQSIVLLNRYRGPFKIEKYSFILSYL